MDLEDQARIQQIVAEQGAENLIVLLGVPDAEVAELCAETVTIGDPSYAGPLAGVPLGLPVYHVLESQITDGLPPEFYQEKLAMMALALDAEAIAAAVRKYREQSRSVERPRPA
jgi:glycine reductase